ncbi:COPII coat Sec23p-Sfb3p heterodimer component, partial [Gonapodya sp. JEL0774]
MHRPPAPLHLVFAIDVSFPTVQSGALARFCQGVKYALYGGAADVSGIKVGVVAYDRAVMFFNVKAALESPQMLVVSDVHDVFVPLNEGFLVHPEECRTNIEALLDSLPTMFESTRIPESAMGAAVQAIDMALATVGGRILLFQSSLPAYGPGALALRDDKKVLGTDQEKTMFQPQDNPLWKKLGTSLVAHGVCMDLFVMGAGHLDVATIGMLPAMTGGHTQFFQGFDYNRDGPKFVNEIQRAVTENFGYDGVMRIRCSTGLRISDHFGNFHMTNSTDVQLAGIRSTTTLAASIQYDSKLDEKADAYFQVALLYTTTEGSRRIRVMNLAVPVTSQIGNVFRYADMDTTVNYLMKTSATQAVASSLRSVREALTDKCVKVLSSYRKNCASSTQPGQLILPESYKLYPLYNLSLMKMKAFRGGPDLPSDVRVHFLRLVKSMSVSTSVAFIYPRVFGLHNLPLDEPAAKPSRQLLPPRIRASYERLDPAGLYVVENGQAMMLWVGRQAPVDLLTEVFAVESIEKVDVSM